MKTWPQRANTSRPGRVVTFYSYKGGVGRSMLLANVGALLARWNHRVLLIDFDLEAPGLDQFFQPLAQTAVRSTQGIVDMLAQVALGRTPNWREFVTSLPLRDGKALDLMHAGRDVPEYSSELTRLNWETLFTERDLGRFLEGWRGEMIGPDGYDYVLVDSRTGITDIGGICTIHLPDALIGLVTTTSQSLAGLKAAMDGAAAGHAAFPTDRERLLTLPITSRDESAHAHTKASEWRRTFAEELGHLLWWRPRDIDAVTVFDWLRIPYETHWSFGEQLPVLHEDVENPKTLSFSYFQVARLLVEDFSWAAVRSRTGQEEEAVARKEDELRRVYESRLRTASAGKRTWLLTSIGVGFTLMLAGGVLLYLQKTTAARIEAEQAMALERAQNEAQAAELMLERARQEAMKSQQTLEAATLAYGQGHSLISKRDYAQAIEAFDRAIDLNPQQADSYRSRAVALDGLARTTGSSTERNELVSSSLQDFARWVDLAPSASRRLQVAEPAATKGRPDIAVDQARKLLGELQVQTDSDSALRMSKIMDAVARSGGRSRVATEAREIGSELKALAAQTPSRETTTKPWDSNAAQPPSVNRP